MIYTRELDFSFQGPPLNLPYLKLGYRSRIEYETTSLDISEVFTKHLKGSIA